MKEEKAKQLMGDRRRVTYQLRSTNSKDKGVYGLNKAADDS